MQSLKNLISTLASVIYNSGSNELLDDHLLPSYTAFGAREPLSTKQDANLVKKTELSSYLCSKSLTTKGCYSEMNNSYPSS